MLNSIDDDPEDCFIMREHLSEGGWNSTILEVHDGIEALTLLQLLSNKNQLPAIIVLDLNMPKMGGLEALDKIKKNFPNVIAVMYSTFYSETDAEKATKLGAHAFFKKPSTYAEGLQFAKDIVDIIGN
jgi:CheY-like chemotaxis protein